MRPSIPLITLLSIISLAVAAQDSTIISFTEEDNGLAEQRFIDRHENFFMTKIPTRKMFKIGYTATTYNGIGINLAFEYKIRPSWSVEASIFTRTNQDGAGISLESWNNQFNGKALFTNIKTRWYLDMQRRIGEQRSENNFSGKYLSLAYETSLAAIQSNRARQHLSVSYGFQSRFLAHGFLDFSLGIYYVTPYWSTIDSRYNGPMSFNISNMAFASRSTMGVAFGDWKRTSSGPLCDVLHCDYYVRQHFKIKFPEISIGIYRQFLRLELAYERKLGKAPISVQIGGNNETTHERLVGNSFVNGQFVGDFQIRYYYLQRSQLRKGKASDNLSGLYVGPRLSYNYVFRGYEKYSNSSMGLISGYQQRLFGNLYFDASVTLSGKSFERRLFVVREFEFMAKGGIGFAI